MAGKEITPEHLSRLTGEVKDVNRKLIKLDDGIRALNTNLVALHALLKEAKNGD